MGAETGQRKWRRGWVFTTAWLAGTFWWLFVSMHTYGGLPTWLAALAVLALAGALALYYAIAVGFLCAWAPMARSAQALLLIYPTWWYGLPAMLKGWLDRVWLPGVAFEIEDGRIRRHMLSNIRQFAVVTTHGSPHWFIRLFMGEPGRKQVVRGLTQHLARGCRVSWNALYAVDTREADALEAWRERTARRLGRFFAG